MGRRMRFAVLSLLLPLCAVACGGSSSETPPPLQPDPTSARYTGPRMPNPADDLAAAAPAAAEPAEDDADDRPRKPAVSTWGSGKVAHPAPAPTPQMTSPTALPPKP